MRTERRDASPGRYRGVVRVTGQRIEATEIPFEVTIKSQRLAVAFLAIVVALFGAAIAASNSKAPDDLAANATEWEKGTDLL